MDKPNARSFQFDPKLLDDRPPFLRVGFHHRAERLGGALLARKNLLPETGEPRLHGGIGQGIDNRPVELADDLPRGTFRSE